MDNNVKQLNSLALAYIGDAVYEVAVRHYLLEQGQVRPNNLHGEAIQYVCASAQSSIINDWLSKDILREDEVAIVRRGRNAKSGSAPKNMSIRDYRYATAFEALLGYHYLSKNVERLDTLLNKAIKYLTENIKRGK